MVIRGATRGNGKQLAFYLLGEKENDKVTILDVDNKDQADKGDLIFALSSWSMMGLLTKTDQSLYHAVINPAYGEDAKMTPQDWNKAVDILAEETGFQNQRRAIVLHFKNDRTHAHVVFERYDHEKGTMISNSFNRLAQDRARKRMELEFEHKNTPYRNKSKPELKKEILKIWQQTKDGLEFVELCNKQGYIITKTAQRRAYSIVDSNGISYDLPRQMKGVNTKNVSERLYGLDLPTDREAIKKLRKNMDAKKLDASQEKFIDKIDTQKENEAVKKEQKLFDLVSDFSGNKDEMVSENPITSKAKILGKEVAEFNEQTQNAKDDKVKKIIAESAEAREKIMEDLKQQLLKKWEEDKLKRLRGRGR
ncbi:MAG: relaxase/mobilization nuclease domain-containing protein [Bacteroidota bacterium]